LKTPEELISELEIRLSKSPDCKARVKELIDFEQIYGDSLREEIEPILDRVTREASEAGYQVGLIICYISELNFQALTKGKEALRRFLPDSLSINEMIEILKKDGEWYPLGMMYLAFYYWFHGDYERGFNLMFDAMRVSEKFSDWDLAWSNYVLGVFYFDTKDYDVAADYFDKSIQIRTKVEDNYGLARALTGRASISIQRNKLEEAVPLLEHASNLFRGLSHSSGLSRALNDMGIVYKSRGDFEKAKATLLESIELRKSLNHLQGLASSYTELGETCLLSGEVEHALTYLNEGLRYATDVDSKQKCMRLHKLLSDVYKRKDDIPSALAHLEKFYELKSELMGDEAANNIKKIQTHFEKEKAEQAAEIERLKNVELKNAYQKIQDQNIELQDTIDELTKTKISRKAIILTLLLAIVLFMLSEGLIDPLIESHSQSLLLSMMGKLAIALMLKPVEGLIEKILLKRVMKKSKKQKMELV
jgi:tetratricopeptide (TPR) repeat protein